MEKDVEEEEEKEYKTWRRMMRKSWRRRMKNGEG